MPEPLWAQGGDAGTFGNLGGVCGTFGGLGRGMPEL